MKTIKFVDLFLGSEKSWRPTAILIWLGFFIGAMIIFVFPENILLNFSSYAITPTVANFVSCSKIKVHVAAFFNLMLMYSLIIALVMTMTVKLKSSDMQKYGRWVLPIIFILLFSIYFALSQLEPSCLEIEPARSARRIDYMINSPFNLLIMGVMFVNGIGVLTGLSFLLFKNFIITKD